MTSSWTIIFVSTLDKNEGTLKISLEKNRNKIQKILANEMTTRNLPKIIFEIDSTLDNVSRINALIDKVTLDE